MSQFVSYVLPVAGRKHANPETGDTEDVAEAERPASMRGMGARGDDDILLNSARAADATRGYYNWGGKRGYSRQSDHTAPAITAVWIKGRLPF